MKSCLDKNSMFAEEFRKKDREMKKYQLRSKFLRLAEDNEKQDLFQSFKKKLELLNEPFDNKIDSFHVIKRVLSSIHAQYISQCLSNQQTSSIIENIFNLGKDQSFKIQINTENYQQQQSLQLTINEFLQLIKCLPAELFKVVTSINQNVNNYKNLLSSKVSTVKSSLTYEQQQNLAASYRQSSLLKIKECFQLQAIAQYCRQYLYVYSKMSENIQFHNKSSQVIQNITDSLIQITAFRTKTLKTCPYQLSLSPLIEEINAQMQKLHLFISRELYQTLIPVIYNMSFSEHKLLISYLHVVGNVIVNLKEGKFNQESQLQQMNQFLLTKLKSFSCNNLNQFLQNRQKKQELKEICFLMVWFLRNQLVVLNNFHVFDQVNHHFQQYLTESVNNLWFPIISNALELMLEINKSYKNNLETFQSIQTNIMDGLELTKVLFNQFTITTQNFQNTLKYLQRLQDFTEVSQIADPAFLNKIYDIYFNLLCNCENQQKLYQIITQKACGALKLGPKYPKIMKLCSKILNPYNRINYEWKKEIFNIFCQNCDNFFIELRQELTLYAHKFSMIELYYQAVLQSQNFSQSSYMLSDILNGERIKQVLELCSGIWSQYGSIEDVVITLQLVRQLSTHEEYVILLRGEIQSLGYYEQLEQLSSHPSDIINRLVYEIYELLEIM